MNPHDALVLVSQLSMGFALAAACGLRAFLPLFAAGLLARTGYVTLGASFTWMSSLPALVVFGSAVVFEFAGDKFPAVDHALDAAGLVVKPAAATLAAASLFTQIDPLVATVMGLVTGATVAGGVHLVKAKVRLISTALTAGIGNPVLSVIEDLVALAGVALAIVIPIFAALTAMSVIALAILWVRRRMRARNPAAQLA